MATLSVSAEMQAIYGVPPLLDVTHGANPFSFKVFLRVARANPADRMWNMTLGDLHGQDHANHHP